MFGAIVGDIAGSTFEHSNCKFEGCEIFARGSRFTDDTVLTLATADHFLFGESYSNTYRMYARRYPNAGYGRSFREWMLSERETGYGSYGNGAAMRASPIGWVLETLEEVIEECGRSAEVTHDHPEGIKGAQAVGTGVFLARTGATREQIEFEISTRFGYDLKRSISEIRPGYLFSSASAQSVPEAIIAFLESTDFEDAIR